MNTETTTGKNSFSSPLRLFFFRWSTDEWIGSADIVARDESSAVAGLMAELLVLGRVAASKKHTVKYVVDLVL